MPVPAFAPVMFDFFSDMVFVIMVMSMSYILFMLYMAFRDNQTIFAIASVIAITMLVINPTLITLFLIFFFFIIFFGQQLQMLLQFGVYPLLSMVGIHAPNPFEGGAQGEMMKMQEVEQKMMEGAEITGAERELYAKNMEKQMKFEQQRNQIAQQSNAAARRPH